MLTKSLLTLFFLFSYNSFSGGHIIQEIALVLVSYTKGVKDITLKNVTSDITWKELLDNVNRKSSNWISDEWSIMVNGQQYAISNSESKLCDVFTDDFLKEDGIGFAIHSVK